MLNEIEQNLTKKERKVIRKENERQVKQQNARQQKIRKLGSLFAVLAIGGLAIAGIIWAVSRQEILPPITMEGHIEKSPESHILSEQMPMAVQKHMLEHADGTGSPGIIINYNCNDFSCEDDLIGNLTKIVNDYPEHVYLAPLEHMSAKLVLTRLGERKIMDNFDEAAIRSFIK